MKVIQIVNQLHCGGAEKLVTLLHQEYLKQSLDSYVISLSDCSSDLESEGVYGLACNSLWSPRVLVRFLKKIKQLSRKGEVIVLHSHLTQSQFWSALIFFLQKFIGRQLFLITTEHDTNNRRREFFIGKCFDYCLYHFYQRIICISSGVEDALTDWLPNVSRKCCVVYNGLDLSKSDDEYSSSRQKDCIRFVSTGRLEHKKGFDLAIRACDQLNKEFTYKIAGEGSARDELQALIDEKQLQGKVQLLGYQEDVQAVLREADIFLMPSRWEGFGLSLLEAMAEGLPSIVSDVAGIDELTNQECSLFFRNSNVKELTSQIMVLLESHEKRQKLGEASKVRSKSFTIEAMSLKYIDVYHEIVPSK